MFIALMEILSLRPLPFERDEIKKAQHLRRCVPRNTLTQGSSLRSPTLGYQKRNPYGVRQSANILCAPPPFEMAIKSATPTVLKRAYQMMIYRFHCENINDNAL